MDQSRLGSERSEAVIAMRMGCRPRRLQILYTTLAKNEPKIGLRLLGWPKVVPWL